MEINLQFIPAFQASEKPARPRGARLPPVGCAPRLRRQAGARGIDRQLGRRRVVRKKAFEVILGSAGRRVGGSAGRWVGGSAGRRVGGSER